MSVATIYLQWAVVDSKAIYLAAWLLWFLLHWAIWQGNIGGMFADKCAKIPWWLGLCVYL